MFRVVSELVKRTDLITMWEQSGGMVLLLMYRRILHQSDWQVGQRAIFKKCKSSHTPPPLPNIQGLLITLQLKVELLKAHTTRPLLLQEIQLFFVFWISVFSHIGLLPVASTHHARSFLGDLLVALPTASSVPCKDPPVVLSLH